MCGELNKGGMNMSKALKFIDKLNEEAKISIDQIKKMTDDELLSLYKDYLKDKGMFIGGQANNGTAKMAMISGPRFEIDRHFHDAGENLLHGKPRYDAPWHMPKMQIWDK